MTYGTCFEERKKVVHVLLQIIQQTHLKTLHTSKGKRDASDRLAKIVQWANDRKKQVQHWQTASIDAFSKGRPIKLGTRANTDTFNAKSIDRGRQVARSWQTQVNRQLTETMNGAQLQQYLMYKIPFTKFIKWAWKRRSSSHDRNCQWAPVWQHFPAVHLSARLYFLWQTTLLTLHTRLGAASA